MGYETITGIVAREVNTGDADRYLSILSVEHGGVECYAKGIRGQKSKLAAAAGLMTYGEYQLHRNGERRILTSAKAFETFYSIREDVVKCAYAAHFLEIARDVVVEAQAFPEALQTLLNTLYVLAYRDTAPELVSRVFETRILALAGFAPVLDVCVVCGARIAPGVPAGFSPLGDGVVCGGCGHGDGERRALSAGALRTLRYILSCEAGALFSFTASAGVVRELTAVIPPYLRRQFGREYARLDEAERYRAFEDEIAERYGNNMGDSRHA